jgi:hypothetical protein
MKKGLGCRVQGTGNYVTSVQCFTLYLVPGFFWILATEYGMRENGVLLDVEKL